MVTWLVFLPLRLCRGVVVFLWVLAVGIISQAGRDDADADAGRWKAIGRWHPDRHKVTPAIGRKGWTKR